MLDEYIRKQNRNFLRQVAEHFNRKNTVAICIIGLGDNGEQRQLDVVFPDHFTLEQQVGCLRETLGLLENVPPDEVDNVAIVSIGEGDGSERN